MDKKIGVWLYILEKEFKTPRSKIIERNIAKDTNISLTNIRFAIDELASIDAIKKYEKGIEVINFDNLLIYTATHRKLNKDIVCEIKMNFNSQEIEALLPNNILFTAFSSYIRKHENNIADYNNVYVYIKNINMIEEIKKRFSENKNGFNKLILLYDKKNIINIKDGVSSVSNIQAYVDMWSAFPEMYLNKYLEMLHDLIIEKYGENNGNFFSKKSNI